MHSRKSGSVPRDGRCRHWLNRDRATLRPSRKYFYNSAVSPDLLAFRDNASYSSISSKRLVRRSALKHGLAFNIINRRPEPAAWLAKRPAAGEASATAIDVRRSLGPELGRQPSSCDRQLSDRDLTFMLARLSQRVARLHSQQRVGLHTERPFEPDRHIR
jgi:hypothetical protein